MIHAFELHKPATLPQERFFALVQRARRIAIEIDGVYDLALYHASENGRWYWSVDVEDEQAWEELQTDPRFLKILGRLKALGVSILPKERLERRV
ncbi:MAG: hypothetical protein RMJ29_05970 [Candidatus Bipolaricaulota bacterium]|nr:hypothetical protein [Candidatus Bipolaricaulota bacterium]